jgi:hypothetical protein
MEGASAMRKLAKWLAGHHFLVMLIALVVVVVPGFIRVEGTANKLEETDASQTRLIVCLNTWTEEVAARSNILADENQARTQALDRLIRSVEISDRELFRQRLAEYIAASDAYDLAVNDNPVPPPPSLHCNGFDDDEGDP